jgi:hypothetical protein
MEKEKIRPIYSELQGYLSQAPTAKTSDDMTYDIKLWEQYNNTVKILNEITHKNHDRFLIDSRDEDGIRQAYIYVSLYRQKLGGLIAALHAEYFSDEPAPFSGMPSTVIHQTQQQSQAIDIQMLLDIRGKIEQELPQQKEGSNEKKFLQKLKDLLGNIKSSSQLFSQILSTAKEFGLSPDAISRLLGL